MTTAKAYFAIVMAAAGALVTALGTGSTSVGNIDAKHWIMAALVVLGSGGVTWWCTNGPWHWYVKAVVGAGGAFLSSLVIALADNAITQAEWTTALTALLAAFSVVFEKSNGVTYGSTVHTATRRA
jgi:hypothetical protein